MKDKVDDITLAACTDPEAGELLASLIFGIATPGERRRFDRHALECDHCALQHFELRPIARAIQHLKRVPATPEAPEPPVAVGADRFLRTYKPWSMAAAALLLAAFLLPLYWRANPPGSPSDWAVIERPALVSDHYRGDTTEEELLRAATAHAENAPAWLELGYRRIERGDIESGVTALKRAAEAEGGALADGARWLLANVYLKNHQVPEAMAELDAVAALGGDHQDRAKTLRDQIRKSRAQKNRAP